MGGYAVLYGSERPQVQKADPATLTVNRSYRAMAVSFAMTSQKAPATVGGLYVCTRDGCQCLEQRAQAAGRWECSANTCCATCFTLGMPHRATLI
jgi:hypothetical protein